MGYLVRECRDVNDDFAIFKKVSAWFFRAEMKSPELIFISSKTILFPLITSLIWADSEVYRVRKTLIGKLLGNAIFVFWNIGYFQKRSTSSIIKWNGSVLNLNHSSIPQTKICQIDTSLLSFFCAFHEQNQFASTRGTDFRQFTATDARFSEFSMFFIFWCTIIKEIM